jgi:hypothetical protein
MSGVMIVASFISSDAKMHKGESGGSTSLHVAGNIAG